MESTEHLTKKCIMLAGVLSVVIMAILVINTDIADRIILLEHRHPLYWEYIATANRKYKEVLRTTAEIEQRRNYIINRVGVIYGSGYTVTTNPDGSFTFSGINNGERDYIYISHGGESFLPDGEYIYSDGGASCEGTYTFIEAVNESGSDRESTWLANMLQKDEEGYFITDHKLYDTYNCVLSIAPGFQSDGITFYPMIRNAHDKDRTYEPCFAPEADPKENETVGYELVEISEKHFYELSDKDLNIYFRSLKAEHPNIAWVSFCFDDGDGIISHLLSCDDKEYGLLNSVGLIIN